MYALPSSTLRYYEDVGILTNIDRTSNGQRIYTQKHINRLGTICCFKRTGMTISQLKDFFSYEEECSERIDDILSLLTAQQSDVENKIAQLKHDLEHVKRKLNYYGDIKTSIELKTEHPCWNNYKNKRY